MISVVILTKNEEQNIKKCLESVKWCNEIIIIDDNSSDRTLEIAKKYMVKVFQNPLSNDFSAQRNYGLSKVKNEWVLFIDADEVVSDALAYEMSNAIGLKDHNLRNYNGFYIKRLDFIWDKTLRYGETGNIKLLRLGKKGSGIWEGKIHEKWEINGLVEELKNPILHYPHQVINEFLKEINFYTDIRVNELKDRKAKVFFWSILIYPLGKFVVNYFLKRGFMDGLHGLIFAVIMSFHSFLVRSKLWLKNEE